MTPRWLDRWLELTGAGCRLLLTIAVIVPLLVLSPLALLAWAFRRCGYDPEVFP